MIRLIIMINYKKNNHSLSFNQKNHNSIQTKTPLKNRGVLCVMRLFLV